MMDKNVYQDAFVDLMGYIREIAEDEETDLTSAYSRGRASGIHAILLAVDTILQAADIDRAEVGLKGFDAASWYEK